MPVYYVRVAPECFTQGDKLVLKSCDGDERVMDWAVALPWLREMQRLADAFDADNRGRVYQFKDSAAGH